jgi:Protein of unknown function (DUF1203)
MRVTPLPAPLTDDPAAIRVRVDKPNAYPCRRCLQDAEVGETVVLLSYDPFVGTSPYSGPGPIYVHDRDCGTFEGDGVPDQLTRRLLSVRAYDERHMLVDADVIEGVELTATAQRLLRDASYLHVHNARPGCFAARIDVDG